MKKKCELLIFDVDGLLLDTESVYCRAWQAVGETMGIPNGYELFMKIIGIAGDAIIPVIQSELQDEHRTMEIIRKARALGLQMLEEEVHTMPYVQEILDAFPNTKKAIATTTGRMHTLSRLERTGILSYFDFILCGDEVTKRKPDPEIYLTVLKKTGVSCDHAIVLEDSPYGVEAAYLAGIDVICIPDLSMPTEKTKTFATYKVKSLKEAITTIQSNYEW